MIQDSKTTEMNAVMNVAQAMCAAARTAPKACGIDFIHTLLVTGGDIGKLADTMEAIAEVQGAAFLKRDAGNLRQSAAVVLIGTTYEQRGLGALCGLCNFDDCAKCAKAEAVCIYCPLDLGIAIGSAVSIAADARIDNRVMFSAGKAALKDGLMDESVKCIMAIPLSTSGKSPYFDRK